ncbi:hypothetical protein BJ165DRAFT_1594212, partial [Panaeolus papilionaceus]
MSSTKARTPTFYSASKLLNLPLELLSLIVSNTSYSSPPAESFKSPPSNSNTLTHPATTTDDLISLSLSHPTFSILAAPYLLRNLTITVSTCPDALTRLNRLAAILRSVPGLERHVRQLKWFLEDPVKLEDGPTLPIDLLERFSCLPNLESLEIHCGVPLSSSYASSESDLETSMNGTWYWKPLYRPNYVSEAAEANHEPNSYTAADAPTYSSPPKPPLLNPILNFYSLFTSYIPTSNVHPSLPNLTNLLLSGITSLPLFPLFQIPSLESLTLSKCNAILKYDGAASPLHYNPPIRLSNHSLKHFKAVEVSIYINLDDKSAPSLPWFLKDVETMWLEDFGFHAPDPAASDSIQQQSTPFSYWRLKELTCAGIIDFHPLVGTGYNTDLNAGDIVSGSTPFPVLQEFVFEQTSSYPTDHLCSLYPYFQNVEILQIGLSSQPQLNFHPPLHPSNLASILSRPEGHLKSLIIRRYESAYDALETLQELSDALSAPSHVIDSLRIPTLQSIIIDLTLTSSDVRNLERLDGAWHRLSSVFLSKKTAVPSMLNLKSIEVVVELVWASEIMMTQGPQVAIELHKYEQERNVTDGSVELDYHGGLSDVGWHSNSLPPWGSDSWGWFTEHENVTSNSGWKSSGWGRDEKSQASEEHDQSGTSTSSYASSYAASSSSQSSVSLIPSPLTPCFPTPKNGSSSAFYPITYTHEPHSIEWDEYPTDDDLKAIIERPLAELVARS